MISGTPTLNMGSILTAGDLVRRSPHVPGLDPNRDQRVLNPVQAAKRGVERLGLIGEAPSNDHRDDRATQQHEDRSEDCDGHRVILTGVVPEMGSADAPGQALEP